MFPREQPISQVDLIQAAMNNIFEELDDELQSAGSPGSWQDFDYTEVPLPGQPLHGGASHVIARPKPGVGAKVWGRCGHQQSWFEDVTVDSRGDMLDSHGCKVGSHAGAPAGSPGQCPSCGCATLLPNGNVAAFCPSCGTPQQPMQQQNVGVQMGPGQAPQVVPVPIPPPPAATHPGPGYNSIRMTGNQKPPVEVPPGLGKVSEDAAKDDFLAFLDKAVEAGQDKTDEGPDPSQAVDEPSQP